jgi:hypothetical protein
MSLSRAASARPLPSRRRETLSSRTDWAGHFCLCRIAAHRRSASTRARPAFVLRRNSTAARQETRFARQARLGIRFDVRADVTGSGPCKRASRDSYRGALDARRATKAGPRGALGAGTGAIHVASTVLPSARTGLPVLSRGPPRWGQCRGPRRVLAARGSFAPQRAPRQRDETLASASRSTARHVNRPGALARTGATAAVRGSRRACRGHGRLG